MGILRYSSKTPYKNLNESGLFFVATGQFGLDVLLGRSVEHLGKYVVYVDSAQEEEWKNYLAQSGASGVVSGGNLFLHPTPSFIEWRFLQVVPLEVLAEDLKLKCPRYLTERFPEISERLPDLRRIILEDSSPESLNLVNKY